MMYAVVVLAVLGLVNSATIEKRALQPMSSYQLQAFTQLFRETLLNKIAVEWNATLDQSHALKAKMDACTTKIKGLTAPCKSCAQSKCQADPSFTDYLNLVNPYTYLEGPIKDMTSKLGDVVDLLGDKSLGFLNSVGDLAKSAGGTIYGGLSTAFSGLKTGVEAVEKGFTDAGSFVIDTAGLIGDLGKDIGSSISHAATDVGHTVVDIGKGIGHAIGTFDGLKQGVDTVASGFTDAGNFVIDTANLIGDGFTDLGHNIGDAGKEIGHAVTDLGSSIGHAIGGIFGRKKRAIDARSRQCMEQCVDCKPLLLPTQQQMIKAVCGDDIINQNNTINARAQKISAIYDTALDKAHPVISKVEFDPASMNGQMQLTNVYVTVYMKGQSLRYKTQVPYAMMDLPTTARNMALEYWSKY